MGNEFAFAVLNIGERTEAVVLELENVFRIVQMVRRPDEGALGGFEGAR